MGRPMLLLDLSVFTMEVTVVSVGPYELINLYGPRLYFSNVFLSKASPPTLKYLNDFNLCIGYICRKDGVISIYVTLFFIRI